MLLFQENYLNTAALCPISCLAHTPGMKRMMVFRKPGMRRPRGTRAYPGKFSLTAEENGSEALGFNSFASSAISSCA